MNHEHMHAYVELLDLHYVSALETLDREGSTCIIVQESLRDHHVLIEQLWNSILTDKTYSRTPSTKEVMTAVYSCLGFQTPFRP